MLGPKLMDCNELRNLVLSLEASEIVHCYIVQFGSRLFANDGSFMALERADDVIVIDESECVIKSQTAFFNDLISKKRLSLADSWSPPLAWRNWLLGIWPGLSVRSGVYRKRSLEKAKINWKIKVIENLREGKNGYLNGSR